MASEANTGSDTRSVVERYNQRWTQGDLAGLFALYHPDLVFTDHYAGKTYQGATLRKHITDVIRRSALDSLAYTDAVRIDGDTAFVQYSETIRSAAGSTLLTVRACDVVRVRNGLIVEIQEYALPVHVQGGGAGAGQSAQRIGLTARGMGYLLNDLATHVSRDRPYLKPSLSLQDVADATGYSRNQISFALNHALGTTFYAFINRARVEHILREHTNLPPEGVLHLARSVGFRSVSTFYAAFRAVTGQRPKDHFG